MNRELQRAQDMITAMQSQRDQALNGVIMITADLAEARRELEAARKRIAELETPAPAPAKDDAKTKV